MGLSRTWNVPDEFWMLWWRSREHRQLIIDVAVEPAGKGPVGRRSAPEFQRQVIDQMERCRRYPMRGPVALDLHFRAAQRNPPSIYRAVKHTLDLLGPALPGTKRPRCRSVLYYDDRQVKFLYADLDQEWSRKDDDGTSTGRLFMVARRASDQAWRDWVRVAPGEAHPQSHPDPAVGVAPECRWPPLPSEESERREGDAPMDKLVKVIVCAFIGWAVGEIAEEALESVGVPKQAAAVAGGIIGAVV